MKKRTKAFLSLIMAVTLVFVMGFVTYVYGETAGGTVDFGDYTISYSAVSTMPGVTITAYSGTLPADFTVPSSLGGHAVTGIGNYAFSPLNANFENINEDIVHLTIPESVRVIGEGAFMNTVHLESVHFSEGLEELGGMAFAMCPVLISIELPSTLTHYGMGALAATLSLQEISVRPGNTLFKTVDNVLYTADMKMLLQYPVGSLQTEFVMPDGVEVISEMSFAYTQLQSIVLSQSLRQIDYSAFFFCQQLTGMNIPASVQLIKEYAFFDCPKLKSMSVANPNMEFEGSSAIWMPHAEFVLYGYSGSTAETYAERNILYAFNALPQPTVKLDNSKTVSALWSTYDMENSLVTDCNGNRLSPDSLAGTGAAIVTTDENGTIIAQQTVAVTGDIDGDGLQNNADYELMKNIAVRAQQLHSGSVFMTVADLEQDGVIDAFDVAAYDLYLFNLTK